MNRVQLKGCLGADPEHRTTQNGHEMLAFSMATNHHYKDSSGEWQTATQWHDIRVFSKRLMDTLSLKKGDRVLVEGQLEYSVQEDARGNKHKRAFIMVTSKGDIHKIDRHAADEDGPEEQEGGDWVLATGL